MQLQIKDKLIRWSFRYLEQRQKSSTKQSCFSFAVVIDDERGEFDVDVNSYRNGVVNTRIWYEQQLVANTPILLSTCRLSNFKITTQHRNQQQKYSGLVVFVCVNATGLARCWSNLSYLFRSSVKPNPAVDL